MFSKRIFKIKSKTPTSFLLLFQGNCKMDYHELKQYDNVEVLSCVYHRVIHYLSVLLKEFLLNSVKKNNFTLL